MKLQVSVQSILVSIFCLGLLRLSADTYKANSSTAANVVSHLERFWPTSFQFGNVRKAFLFSLRGKIIANILRFLGRKESKLVRRNSKKLPKLFHYGFAEKNFKQKRPECPFKCFEFKYHGQLIFVNSKQYVCLPKDNCCMVFRCDLLANKCHLVKSVFQFA